MKKFYLFLVALVVSVCTGYAYDLGSATKYALHGEIFTGSWPSGDAPTMTNNNGVWEIVANVTEGNGSFGIRAYEDSQSSQKAWISSADASNYTFSSTVTSLKAGKEGDAKKDFKLNVESNKEYKITFNPATMEVTVNPVNGGEVTPPAEIPELWVRGEMNGFGCDDDWKMSSTDGENYILEHKSVTTGQKFKIAGSDWEGKYNYGSASAVPFDDPTYLYERGDNSSFKEGSTDVTFKFTLSSQNLTIVNNNVTPPTPTVSDLYFFYQKSGVSTWEKDSPEKMNYADGVYTLDVDFSNLQYFVFRTYGTSLNWDSSDKQWGPAGEDKEVALNEATTLNNGSNKAFTCEGITGIHTVKVTLGETTGSVTVVGEVVPEPEAKAVYLNLGATYVNDTKFGGSAPVYAYFRKANGDWIDGVAMTRVYDNSYIFKAVIPSADCDRVHFGNGESGNDQFEIIIDPDQFSYEADNWDKYVYSIHTVKKEGQADKNYAIQSYVTFEEYDKIRTDLVNGDLSKVYLTGYFNGWDNYFRNMIDLSKEPLDGIYSKEIELSNVSGLREFKMTFMNPRDFAPATGEDMQRLWAVFDLGVIGPDDSNEIVRPDNSTPYVVYKVREPMTYNFYNNYNWVFEGKTGEKIHLVIDPSTGVTVMLTFNPNPKISKYTVKAGSPTANTDNGLSGYEIEGMGTYLLGTQYSGAARIRRANQSDGVLEITPAENRTEEFTKLYTVEYSLFFNGTKVAEFDQTTLEDKYDADAKVYKMTLPGLVPGNKDEVTFNAEYTYIENQKKFHSHTTLADYDNKQPYKDLGTPDEVEVTSCVVRPVKYENGEWTWDALVAVKFALGFDAEVDNLVFYPACDVTNANGDHGYVVDSNDVFYTNEMFSKKHNWGDYKIHTKYVDGEYVHGTHNWSIKARDVQTFHLCIPDVKRTTYATWDNATFSFTLEANASYPYLISKVDETFGLLRNAPAAQAEEENAVKVPMTFHIVEAGRTYNLEATNITAVSGVNDIELGEAEGEYELFNLQGIRVEGQPAPGVYLRRNGNTVEKVYIR